MVQDELLQAQTQGSPLHSTPPARFAPVVICKSLSESHSQESYEILAAQTNLRLHGGTAAGQENCLDSSQAVHRLMGSMFHLDGPVTRYFAVRKTRWCLSGPAVFFPFTAACWPFRSCRFCKIVGCSRPIVCRNISARSMHAL